ncbi:MAG TPA: low molecular weight protein-tyrosine-phosphatase [Lentimicrobium sp.]|nr:low molecular weight protein-tyrosine-phosphatase [Lentimicrobium sp.]
MIKILMVCLGNICRSPLAEGILKEKIKNNNLDAMVESCGFEAFHVGDQPDKRAIEIASLNKIDIRNQRARLFKPSFFDFYDKIYVMDENNYKMVSSKIRSKEDLGKVDFIMNVLDSKSNTPVADPYFGGKENFRQTWEMLDRATDKIIDLIKKDSL